MSYRVLPAEMLLSGYGPRVIGIDCLRCKKGVLECDVTGLQRRFGGNMTDGQVAQQVALASTRAPCFLAGTGNCAARALEPPVWHWASLDDARTGGWRARLHCRRHLEALKRASPCPEVFDLETLVMVLGYDFKLERLSPRCRCPKCHVEMVEI